MIQKITKKNSLIFNILNNFDNVDRKLNDENKNISGIRRQILTGNKVLSNIKTLKNNNNNYNSYKIIYDINKNNVDNNKDDEIKPLNRLNIYNYLPYFNTELNDNKNNNHKKNLLQETENQNNIIAKSLLDKLYIENQNKIKESRKKFKEGHDCNKRKKLKLKPINLELPKLNNSLSQSNKSIFYGKIAYYNNRNKLKNLKQEKIKNYLDKQNTSYYSSLFKNTTVNIIKNKNGEDVYENPYFSPSLKRNLWEEFQIVDNGENETYEKSIMIKEGINDINNNKYKPYYLSVKKDKNNENNKFDDITKIRTKKEIEKFLSINKKSAIFKNIKFKKNNLKPIIPKLIDK